MAGSSALKTKPSALVPGIVLCLALALLAKQGALASGWPAMVLVLLIGIVLRALGDRWFRLVAAGTGFSASWLLRLGVGLLGARIVFDDLASLGLPAIGLVLISVVATLTGGYYIARRFGVADDLARVSATSVGICGASAALAAASVMPSREDLGRDTALVIVIVCLLSTLVMVLYPPLAQLIDFDANQTALMLGAAVHDVAQVVGAGFAVSDAVGVKAVTVKMIRVSCLVPVVIVLARQAHRSLDAPGVRGTRLPWFLWMFIGLALLSSLGWLPLLVTDAARSVSSLLLLCAVAAIGLQTELSALRNAPAAVLATLVLQTLWQLAVVVCLIFVIA